MELSRIDFALMKVLQSRNCTAYFSGMTMQELISIVEISRSAAYRRLNRLIAEGYIEKACKNAPILKKLSEIENQMVICIASGGGSTGSGTIPYICDIVSKPSNIVVAVLLME